MKNPIIGLKLMKNFFRLILAGSMLMQSTEFFSTMNSRVLSAKVFTD